MTTAPSPPSPRLSASPLLRRASRPAPDASGASVPAPAFQEPRNQRLPFKSIGASASLFRDSRPAPVVSRALVPAPITSRASVPAPTSTSSSGPAPAFQGPWCQRQPLQDPRGSPRFLQGPQGCRQRPQDLLGREQGHGHHRILKTSWRRRLFEGLGTSASLLRASRPAPVASRASVPAPISSRASDPAPAL